jgi:hypothetical protein
MPTNLTLIVTAEDLGWEEGMGGSDRASWRAGVRARFHRLLEAASQEQREHAQRVRAYWRWRIRRHLGLG